jgi:uncharacterized membrane protein YdbT with pleckstrin-like domain
VDLAPEEKVIYEGHPSWRSILGFYLKGMLLAILAGAVTAGITVATDEVRYGWIALVMFLVLIVVLFAGWIKRIATHYTITSKRLYIRRGILSRHEEQARVDRLQDLTTSQSFLERILRVGTVDFDTAGGEEGDLFRFQGVSDPQRVIRAVDEAQAAGAAESGGTEAKAT